jgi:L-lactate dehydrogenase (cytochrome)
MDVPVRTTRSREVAVGITNPFRVDLRMVLGTVTSPGYLMAFLQNGMPRFVTLAPYAGGDPSVGEMTAFLRGEQRGAFTWEEVARYRERWKRPLVVKGILHPQDAEKAVTLGVDGVIVSNHGGRQVEALPAPIDCLPAVVAAVGKRATVMMDSGIRSGLDVIRAVALGAELAFAGKAFLWGLGALGADGPRHVIEIMNEEARAALGQIGARTLAEARSVVIRQPGALRVAAEGARQPA